MVGMGAKPVTVNTSSGSDGKRDSVEKKLFKVFSNLREVLTNPETKTKAQDGIAAVIFGIVPTLGERIAELAQNSEQREAVLESTKDFTGYQGTSLHDQEKYASKGFGMGQEMPTEMPEKMGGNVPENSPNSAVPGMQESAGNEELDAMLKQLQGGGGQSPEMPPGTPQAPSPMPTDGMQ